MLDPLNFGLRVIPNQRLGELNLLLGANLERAVGALEELAGTLVHLQEAVRLLLLSPFKDDIGPFEGRQPANRALHAFEDALEQVHTFNLLAVDEVLPFEIEGSVLF